MATVSPSIGGGVQAQAARIVENGAGTYIADFNLPANSTLIDIIVEAEALWAAGTSASMEVGDTADPDGWFTAVNLKATDLAAGESISLLSTQVQGGKIGAYSTGTATHITRRFSAAPRSIRASVVSVGAGTTGATRVTVVYGVAHPTTVTQ